MPEDLVARISQSLQLEQQRRSSGGGDSAYPAAASATPSAVGSEHAQDSGVVSLTAERQRRRPGRTILWLGGAAAVAMVATVSVNQLVGGSDTDTGVSARVPAANDSAEGGADAGAEDLDVGGDNETAGSSTGDEDTPEASDDQGESTQGSVDEAPVGGAGDGAAAEVAAVPGTVELSATGWSEQVSSWMDARPGHSTDNQATQEATDCVATGALDTEGATTLVLSDALWDDQPAILVVAEDTSGDTAWVLSTDCADVLSGPSPLP
ncbi:hypothetical protein [Ornithinimicrobium cavernae]|uniref:hypothetical protein n=1 Tax=Ornithinimicrobium cavernae TaxID=2666047 RepID=UPI000D69B5E4|nr:hypothetical protein [Ornithinimicrobium cavernae]